MNGYCKSIILRARGIRPPRSMNSWMPPKINTNCAGMSSSLNDDGLSPRNADSLLRNIMSEYSRSNQKFVLPLADASAMDEIKFCIEKLLELGVTPEFILDACTKRQQLFRAFTINGSNSFAILETLVNCCGWTYEDAIRFFAQWSEELLSVTPESIQRRLDVFLGRGILAGLRMGAIVQKCPAILFASEPQKMDQTWEHISQFFFSGNIKKMLQNSPLLCLKDSKELEQKYEYIHMYMGIEPNELMNSLEWMNLPIEEIQDRHNLLKKTEKYATPNPKKPQISKENASAKAIFDSSDEELSKLAGVSVSEWTVFRQLCEINRARSDQDEPFDRIKLEHIRAFERQPKEPRQKIDGELE